jgi:hypothetical protein
VAQDTSFICGRSFEADMIDISSDGRALAEQATAVAGLCRSAMLVQVSAQANGSTSTSNREKGYG